MYNGEEDILDIRLNTLDSIVDKFIFIESPLSHSLLPRELEFSKQKNRFKKFEHKIDYYSVNYCTNENFTVNDFLGRRYIQEILFKKYQISSSDFIIHGDLDEIPRLSKLKDAILSYNKNKPSTLMIDSRLLCFDLEGTQIHHNRKKGNFPGSMLLIGDHINNNELYRLRQIRCNPIINNIDYKDTFNLIENAGWHFSYCAGIDRTVDKFKFFCHADEMPNCIKDREGLLNCIKNKISFAPDKQPLDLVPWKLDNFPEYLYNNTQLFKENLSFNYK
jgi:beta-1,4-mannosyl-glycoprotein beta-1,4-N-acetylglucosaminyltransferase